jgi:TonB family protein
VGLGLIGDGDGGGCAGCTMASIGRIGTNGRGGGHDRYPSGIGLLSKKGVIDIGGIDAEPPVCIGLDKDLIRQVVRAHRNEIRYCYELALTSNPKLRGKTAVKFTIAPSGTVTAASITDSNVHEVDDCVTSRVRSWNFPKPPGGGTAIVTYPFVFSHE